MKQKRSRERTSMMSWRNFNSNLDLPLLTAPKMRFQRANTRLLSQKPLRECWTSKISIKRKSPRFNSWSRAFLNWYQSLILQIKRWENPRSLEWLTRENSERSIECSQLLSSFGRGSSKGSAPVIFQSLIRLSGLGSTRCCACFSLTTPSTKTCSSSNSGSDLISYHTNSWSSSPRIAPSLVSIRKTF